MRRCSPAPFRTNDRSSSTVVDIPSAVRSATSAASPEAGRILGLRERHIEGRPDDRERVAQLMRGVLDERALRPDAAVEPVEHPVEGIGQIAQLVLRAVEMDAPGEVGRLDVAGDGGDPADRPGDAPGDDPADAEADRYERGQADDRQRPEAGERRVADLALGVDDRLVDAEEVRQPEHVEDLGLEAGRGDLARERQHLVEGQIEPDDQDADDADEGGGIEDGEAEPDRPQDGRNAGVGSRQLVPRSDSRPR